MQRPYCAKLTRIPFRARSGLSYAHSGVAPGNALLCEVTEGYRPQFSASQCTQGHIGETRYKAVVAELYASAPVHRGGCPSWAPIVSVTPNRCRRRE